ncbi:MAG TPA: hypothetical protein VE218_04350, partial [Acidobacteriaceae bacterium]|nr:hypothetical protein [Acidobacteriaceae bacterium]
RPASAPLKRPTIEEPVIYEQGARVGAQWSAAEVLALHGLERFDTQLQALTHAREDAAFSRYLASICQPSGALSHN